MRSSFLIHLCRKKHTCKGKTNDLRFFSLIGGERIDIRFFSDKLLENQTANCNAIADVASENIMYICARLSKQKMKHILILGDGMADEPVDMLEGRTPLQYAHTPCMDELARRGSAGRLRTVPDGFQPGSEVANLSVLGYDLTQVYEG